MSYELTRDEILSLIDNKAWRAGRDLGFVLRHHAAGALDDFGKLAEAYAFCDLLDRADSRSGRPIIGCLASRGPFGRRPQVRTALASELDKYSAKLDNRQQ